MSNIDPVHAAEYAAAAKKRYFTVNRGPEIFESMDLAPVAEGGA